MSVQDLYPAGSFDDPRGPVSGSNDPNNSRAEDHAFSGPGDIDRTGDDDTGEPWEPTSAGESGSTNERSRAWNALAADSAQPLDFGRANPQAGSGGTVGDDDLINHAYGES
jgi:hypothetical protein